jgi:hypothetical protein
LYNILNDPMEVRDVSAAEPQIASQLRADLVTWLESFSRKEVEAAQEEPAPFTCEAGQLDDGSYH